MRLSHQNHPKSLETHTSGLSGWKSQVVEAPEGDTGPLLGSTPEPPNRLRSYSPAPALPCPALHPLPHLCISLTALRNPLLRN